jgi:GT2 family glycosyltransferase
MELLMQELKQKVLRGEERLPATKIRKLTIILPVYNPHRGWETRLIQTLNKIKTTFRDVEYYVTIVNDGSQNDLGFFIETELIPKFQNLKYLSYPKNMGKGYAIRFGLMHSFSNYYIYTDFDIPFGIESLRAVYDSLSDGKKSLVLGKRGFSYLKSLPPKRLSLSIGLMFLNSIHTKFRVSDTQAGLKGLDNKARRLFLTTRTNSFIFELEFIMKCLRAEISHTKIGVNPEKDIKLTNFGTQTIRRELINYFNIIFESRKRPTTLL